MHASKNLNNAFNEQDPEGIKRSVCMLALSCGRCHAAFRKVRFDNLKKRVEDGLVIILPVGLIKMKLL